MGGRLGTLGALGASPLRKDIVRARSESANKRTRSTSATPRLAGFIDADEMEGNPTADRKAHVDMEPESPQHRPVVQRQRAQILERLELLGHRRVVPGQSQN